MHGSTDSKRQAMPGLLKIACKLLVNAKRKFTALLIGITFAVFLRVTMTSLFAGVLRRTYLIKMTDAASAK